MQGVCKKLQACFLRISVKLVPSASNTMSLTTQPICQCLSIVNSVKTSFTNCMSTNFGANLMKNQLRTIRKCFSSKSNNAIKRTDLLKHKCPRFGTTLQHSSSSTNIRLQSSILHTRIPCYSFSTSTKLPGSSLSRKILRSRFCINIQCSSFSTSSKDKGTEMTEEERQLYKAIKSEMDCSPVEEKLIAVTETSTSSVQEPEETNLMIPKKGKKKKTEKFKEKMVENLNFPNVTVYGVGRLDLDTLQEQFENDELYVVCQLPPEFRKEVLMVRSKNKKQDGTYTDAFFFRSYGVACWAMNQHQGEELVMKAMNSSKYSRGLKIENLFTSLQEVIDNREVFRTVQSESIKRVKDRIHIPSLTDDSLFDDKKSLNLALNKYTFSKALLQSVVLGLFEERLDDFIENRGLLQRTQELKLGIDSSMNSKNVYSSFGEISYIRYQTNLSDLFTEDPDEYWEYDDLSNLYTDMISYLSLPKRLRELNRNLDYCQDLIKLFNDRLTDKHHVHLEKIIIGLIFIEVMIELIRMSVPYIQSPLRDLFYPSTDSVIADQEH